MKILFLGDIFGRPGREAVVEQLPFLVNKHQIDFVIANGENAAHGRGITKKTYLELIAAGIDCITVGNHFKSCRESLEFFDEATALIRPLNIYKTAPGIGTRVFEKNGHTVRVSAVLGRVMITDLLPSDPFAALHEVVEKNDTAIHIVDFHGETTAEKYAFGYHFAGLVSGVIGTHTHVQTNDARILPGGTGYISDAGMCGPRESIIGCEIKSAIERTMTGLSTHLTVAEGPAQINGIVLDVDSNGICKNIEIISINPQQNKE